uniref:Protein tyrosine phosphatase receptor type B n=1 Tax=Sphaeramia orbicularis TaxID=375764 RepID=A0A673A7T7_9TELE
MQLWEHLSSQGQSGLLRNETVESTATQLTLQNLTPGRLYNITMVTEAGGLQNSRTIEAQTVPSAVSHMTSDDNVSMSDQLHFSWQQPEGDLDALVVTISLNGTKLWEMTLPPDATQVTSDHLTPGSAYQVVVISKSGGLTNQSEITVRTVPAAVSDLTLSQSSSGGLMLSWSPPAGFWETYRVFLFDGSQQLVNATVSQEVLNFSFPGIGLIPGKLYQAVLRVESGGLTADSICEGSTAPAPVLDLHIRHADETSISAMWSHAPIGSRDSYFLTLRNETVNTREVEPNMRECTFNVLTPGRHYTITVTTRSGKLNTSVSVEGKTVPMALTTLSLSSSGVDSLRASWEKPPGDVESFTLTLLQDSVVVQNHSVPAGSSSLMLTDLTPGALYRLQATAVSGGVQSKTTSLEARTVPASVSRVTASNGGRSDALQVSWRPAVGVVDSYLVHLQDGSRMVHTLAVSHSSPPECSFSSLFAGRLYSVVIVTRSGSLENATTVQARTPITMMVVVGVYHVLWYVVLQNKSVSAGHNECVFSSLTPGRLYTITVETWSGGYVSSVSTDGRTFPAAVGNLSLGDAGTGDLTITWSSAPGDVDHYEVTLLFNDTRVFPPVTLGSEVRHHRLTSLTPGRLYKIVVSTFSGPYQRPQFIEGRTVPSAVGNLRLDPRPGLMDSLGGLGVSWTPGDGDLDMYIVSLSNTDGVVIETRPVPKHISSLEFMDLIPGQTYTMNVQSLSGKLTNSNTASGRTAPARVTALQADNDHTTHSLTVTWERPVGVFDGYSLQLQDEAGAIMMNRSVVSESRSERLEGLTAGKWYRVQVVTLSGGVASQEATAEGQTRPAAVSNLTVTSTNTSSLSFSWRPSVGHVDIYDLSLYSVVEATANHKQDAAETRKDHHQVGRLSGLICPYEYFSKLLMVVLYDASGTPLGSQTLGAEHTSHTFPGLTPGRLYRTEVISHSGEQTNRAVVLGRTTPDPPTHLSVKQGPTNDTIELSWSGPASGDYDNFSLQWTPTNLLSVTQTHLTGCIVGGMFPGRLYNFTVMTVSGGGAKGEPTARSQPIQRSVRTSSQKENT